MKYTYTMKLLIDHSVLAISKTHHYGRYLAPSWNGTKMVAHIAQREIKHDGESQHKKNLDINALKGLNKNHLMQIQLYTYHELSAELDRGFSDYGATYIFDHQDIQHLSNPLEKSSFFDVLVTDYDKKENLVRFVKFLINSDPNVLLQLGEQRCFSESKMDQLKCLKDLKSACEKTQETHYPDIFHLWTAACFNLDGFLTADYKLCNLFRNTLMYPSGLGHPITPSELLDKLKFIS